MDLPVILEVTDFVSDLDEVKQSVAALLKTELGEFVQTVTFGTSVTIHTPGLSIQRMDYAVRQCLKPLNGLTVTRVYIIDNSDEEDVLWGIDCTYNGTDFSVKI